MVRADKLRRIDVFPNVSRIGGVKGLRTTRPIGKNIVAAQAANNNSPGPRGVNQGPFQAEK
jgi:hypothetical protein